jgi:hypothetical protein
VTLFEVKSQGWLNNLHSQQGHLQGFGPSGKRKRGNTFWKLILWLISKPYFSLNYITSICVITILINMQNIIVKRVDAAQTHVLLKSVISLLFLGINIDNIIIINLLQHIIFNLYCPQSIVIPCVWRLHFLSSLK